MTCALFQCPKIELCLIPMSYNWIVPSSNAIEMYCALFQCCKMKCALFECHQIELCLIPISQNEMCLIPFPSKWNVPYSNAKKLNCALFQCHEMKCAPSREASFEASGLLKNCTLNDKMFEQRSDCIFYPCISNDNSGWTGFPKHMFYVKLGSLNNKQAWQPPSGFVT